jgi:hypothetical protein
VIDVGEEFSDVAFQNPDRVRVVLRDFESLVAETIYGSVCAFDASTRVRVENKFWIEVRIQDSVNGVMQKPIPDGRFVNVARFWIVDPKRLIRPVLICFVRELLVQAENVVGQMKRKSLDVFTSTLVTKKFTPRSEQIFYGDDIMVDVTRPHSSLSLSLSLS